MSFLTPSHASFFALVCTICSLFFSACSDKSSLKEAEEESKEETLIGFFLFSEMDKSVALGKLKVKLDYDFYLGVHEVTQGEFAKIFNRKVDSSSADMPQVNVTFFDAVLYANELSKIEDLDTAYIYKNQEKDFDGNGILLDGLKFISTANGYRLPTEAEWVYASQKNWNLDDAWNAENSELKIHNVCQSPTADKIQTAVCDMAGNVKEWVNDWFGSFVDTTLYDYAGAASANDLEERILKGGSYLDKLGSISQIGRTDIYTVTSLSKASYVGFRLAKGSIPNPTWLSYSGAVVVSPVTPIASAKDLFSVLKTYQAKLVFRNDMTGNLSYIDYAVGGHSVKEIQDTLSVYHPDVSPDGDYVAFCTRIEGVSGSSSLYVRRLDSIGSGLVKLNVESAAIPRFRTLSSGDTVIVYVSNTGDNSKSEWNNYSTWQVPFSNGKFGNPQKILNGAFHGGIGYNGDFIATGFKWLRTVKKTNVDKWEGAVWYNNEQVCNASVATDGTDRVLFLDFGSSTGISFVGKSYAPHEELLIANNSGTLIQAIEAPNGTTFDHTEWIPYRSLAVATLSDINGAHFKIVVVNLKDSSTLELVEGEELWHPTLWVKKPFLFGESSSSSIISSSSQKFSLSSIAFTESSSSSDFESSSSINSTNVEVSSSSVTMPSIPIIDYELDLDSAGQYYLRNITVAEILRSDMELFWKYHDSLNVAVLGSSRAFDAIVPLQLDSRFFAVNFSQTPNSIHLSKFYWDHYIKSHTPHLKYLIIALDFDLWTFGETSSTNNFFYSTYKSVFGYVYDENHNFWIDGIPRNLATVTEDDITAERFNSLIATRGYYGEGSCKGWNAICNNDSTVFDTNPKLLESAFNAVMSIIESAKERGVIVIGVVFPVSPEYKNSGSFACYGIRRSTADSLIQVFKNLQKTNFNFVLMDENKMGNHDYPNQEFEDQQHLCPVGARRLTSRINSILLEQEE